MSRRKPPATPPRGLRLRRAELKQERHHRMQRRQWKHIVMGLLMLTFLGKKRKT